MIIDGRLRPATELYLGATIDLGPTWHTHYGVGLSESVKKRSMELCIKEMDEAGISIGLAPARWGAGNSPLCPPEEVVQVMHDYQGRFYGAIPLDAEHPFQAMQDIETFIVNGPVRGVCIDPGIAGVPHYVDDRVLFPIYDLLQEKGIPALIMAGGCCGPDASYADPIHLERLCTVFPNLVIIDCHGSVPYVQQAVFAAARHPNLYLCPDMYMYNTPYAREFVDAANCMIQDQFLFGSSYPFIPMKDALDIFLALPFKSSVLDKVLYKNIARALDIDISTI